MNKEAVANLSGNFKNKAKIDFQIILSTFMQQFQDMTR